MKLEIQSTFNENFSPDVVINSTYFHVGQSIEYKMNDYVIKIAPDIRLCHNIKVCIIVTVCYVFYSQLSFIINI